ncbi:MAG: hypothetical protein ACXWYI_08115 [Actinomycetota bacterium]
MSMLAAIMDAMGDRKRLRSRIVAGVMVAVLALGATAAVWVALRGDDEAPPVAAYVPPRVATVWPESGLEDQETARVVQDRADNHDPEIVWRRSPGKVVHAFVASVLGWSDPDVRPQYPGLQGPDRWYTATEHASCPAGAICDPPVSTLDIEVVQPARRGEDGIWSVAGVRSSGLRLVADGVRRPVAGTIPGVAAKAAGLRTVAGAQWYDGCTGGHDIVDEIRRPSRFEITLPEPMPAASPGCGSVAAGYAYAYAVPRLTQPVGDPLLESAPLTDLTIVPIRVRVAGEAPSGDSASIAEPGLTTWVDPLGWRVDYPSDWTVTPITFQDRVSTNGAAFSNVSLGVASPNAATPRPVGLDPGRMPSDAVEVVITHSEGGPVPDLLSDDSPFPVTLDGLGCPLADLLQCGSRVRGGGRDFSIEVRRGQDASPEDIAAAEALVASMRFRPVRLGEQSNGWASLGRPALYPPGVGSAAWVGGRLGVVYVMRGPKGTYALDLNPDGCGEGENETWDPKTLQIWVQCPAYLGTTDMRYDRFGNPDPSNAPKFQSPLDAYPVITAWDGSLLIYVDGSMDQLPRMYWP